jgi:hypothetical protein
MTSHLSKFGKQFTRSMSERKGTFAAALLMPIFSASGEPDTLLILPTYRLQVFSLAEKEPLQRHLHS